MTVHIRAEADAKLGPGHAVILVDGAKVAPDDIRFNVRRPGYREDSLGPSGWQAAEAHIAPDAAYVAGGTLYLHVGPNVVSHMEPGMNVAFSLVLPDGRVIDGRLAWPAIAGPIGGAGARRGRLVATRRQVAEGPALRTVGALVGDHGETTAGTAADAETVPAAQEQAQAAEPAAVAAEAEPAEATEEPGQAAGGAKPAPELEPEPEPVEHLAAARGALRATRDAPAPVRRGPWRRRVAAVASIAVLLIAGTAVASYYLGRDQICANESIGPVIDGWGLCPPVVVAAAPEPAPAAPADDAGAATEGGGWNIDPLAWLGPYLNREGPVDRGAPEDAVTGDAGQDATDDAGQDAAEGAAADAPVDVAEVPDAPAAPAPEPDTPASQRALALEYLSTQPSPEAAFARANELFAEAQVDAAFLIYRYAAEGGHDEAAVEVAAMYDPETYSAETSPLPRPNAEEARLWYQRAVDAGNVRALLPLARLLAADNAIEDAREVLRLAEQAGLGDAARLLEELQ